MKLWLDDEREAPEGWTRVVNVRAAMQMLLTNQVGELSLDHDLGLSEPTGSDLLHAMSRLAITVPKIAVHSMNPPAAEAMRALIDQCELEHG